GPMCKLQAPSMLQTRVSASGNGPYSALHPRVITVDSSTFRCLHLFGCLVCVRLSLFGCLCSVVCVRLSLEGSMRSWERAKLRRVAMRYAEQGWHVLPGAYLVRPGRGRHTHERRFDCGEIGCRTVACHPALSGWETMPRLAMD